MCVCVFFSVFSARCVHVCVFFPVFCTSCVGVFFFGLVRLQLQSWLIAGLFPPVLVLPAFKQCQVCHLSVVPLFGVGSV